MYDEFAYTLAHADAGNEPVPEPGMNVLVQTMLSGTEERRTVVPDSLARQTWDVV